MKHLLNTINRKTSDGNNPLSRCVHTVGCSSLADSAMGTPGSFENFRL